MPVKPAGKEDKHCVTPQLPPIYWRGTIKTPAPCHGVCPPPAKGGKGRADPYRVWLSEVMLQQTTVAAVKDYFNRFTTRWPDVAALAAADDGDVMAEWAGLGYYARARNLLKCARMVASQYQGQFPNTYQGLLALPGIGPYTAAAISTIAFDQPETVVDGNVERVMARLYDVHTPPARSQGRTDRPRRSPNPPKPPRRLRPSGDGFGRNHLHTAQARLRPMPLAGRLPGTPARHGA